VLSICLLGYQLYTSYLSRGSKQVRASRNCGMVKLKLVCIAELCTMPRKKSSGLSGNGPGAKANTPRSTAEDEEAHLCHMRSHCGRRRSRLHPGRFLLRGGLPVLVALLVCRCEARAASTQLCQLFIHWSGQEVECRGEQGEGEREWEKGQGKG